MTKNANPSNLIGWLLGLPAWQMLILWVIGILLAVGAWYGTVSYLHASHAVADPSTVSTASQDYARRAREDDQRLKDIKVSLPDPTKIDITDNGKTKAAPGNDRPHESVESSLPDPTKIDITGNGKTKSVPDKAPGDSRPRKNDRPSLPDPTKIDITD